MHFHNSCTQNCDHHILLIMIGNVHKESCHKLLLILVREQGLHIIQINCSGKMVVAFTIKEQKLIDGKPILPIGAATFLFIFDVLSSSFGCAIGLISGSPTKAAIVLSIFSFTNCSGSGHMLIFSYTWNFITMI